MGRSTQILTLVVIAIYGAQIGHAETKMEIHSMHIDTRVMSRFARTFVTMEVQNPSNSSQEAIFDIELPKTAFISNFIMTIDNVTTVATVSEKAEAKKTYQKAVSRGQSAGLVQSTGRKMEHFKISVNVGPLARATFKLTYEELLKRQLGNYKLQIRVKPRGLVDNFQINVDVIEPQGISFLNAVGTFMSNELVDLVRVNRTDRKAHIELKPTLSQQRTCPTCHETHLDGELVITYDVKRDNSAGKLQVINGYFVHYFAPPSLQRIPKNVVFVIDRSGSMSGNKIKQTYEAFLKILEDVPEEDFFTILTFDDKVDKWRKQLVKAKPDNIKKAKEFVSKITPRGGTDINKALLTAAKMLTNATFNNLLPEVSVSIIIFLSDGDPTSGTTDRNKIIDNVKKSLEGRASLYCLGFGNDVDYNFLEKLSLQNGGLARRIYEDSDSALQLQDFYNEVAYPMLLDVQLQYSENSVEYLTQNSFRQFFQGSEIIVAGSINNSSQEVFTAEVTARGVSETFSVKVETNVNEEEEVEKEQQYIFRDFIERLWAYLTIDQLMTKLILLEANEKKEVTQKALSLSLKYNFVTPLTSLVVTEPQEEDKKKQLVANKPKEDDVFQDEEFDLVDNHYYVDYDSAVYPEANDHNPDARLIVNPISKLLVDTSARLLVDTSARLLVDTGESFDIESRISHKKIYTMILATLAPPPPPTIPATTKAPDEGKCQTFHVLLTKPRICVQITHDDDGAAVNLLHDAATGITLNGRLAGKESFARYGLMNSKLGVRVHILKTHVQVTRGPEVTTYNWNSSFEVDGFLQMRDEKITVTVVKDGVNVTIFRVDESFRLSLSVDSQNVAKDNIGGIIGQFLNNNKKLIAEDDQTLPKQVNPHCDFSPYGVEERGSCLLTSLQAKDYVVLFIFALP